MLNIYKLIEHLVQNLVPLNEYSEGMLKRIIEKFKEEADDKNIEISDSLLTKYIQQFDNMKNSPSVTEKDIMKWPLQKLMRTVASSVKDVDEDEWDPGHDVLYDEDGIIVWNGNTEDRCIRFARNEAPWCIARGSFANYHMDPDRGYPVFYLLRNTNLDDSDSNSDSYNLSFMALQVRNPDKYSDGKNYVYTLRKNYPYESERKSWDEVISEVPWVNDIPNIKDILKYVAPSRAEMEAENNVPRVRANRFQTFPFDKKQTYLRKRGTDSDIVSDLNNVEFIKRYVATDNKLGQWFAQNPTVGREKEKLETIESFPKSAQNSIVANLRQTYEAERYLFSERFSWNVKKLLTYKNMWETMSYIRIYVTADKETIVAAGAPRSNGTTTVRLGIVTEHEEHEDIKVNKNTVKYLIDFPVATEEDKAIFQKMIPIISGLNPEVDKNILKVIEGVYKKVTVEGQDFYYDPSSLTGFRVGEGSKLESMSTEEVLNILPEEDKEETFSKVQVEFKRALLSLQSISNHRMLSNIPLTLIYAAVEAMPYADRTRTESGYEGTLLVSPTTDRMFIPKDPGTLYSKLTYDERALVGDRVYKPADYKVYLEYLKETGAKLEWRDVRDIIQDTADITYPGPLMEILAEYADAVFSDDTKERYKVVVEGDVVYVVDLEEAGRSKKFTMAGGGRSSLSDAEYNRLAGREEETPEAGGETQSQRPVRQTGTQPIGDFRPSITADTIRDFITGTIGVEYDDLPNTIKARLEQGAQTVPNDERGARLRNRLLGGRGTVTTVLRLAGRSSAAYIIRMDDGPRIISLAMQPGNIQGIIHGAGWTRMNSVNDLLAVLQDNQLAEEFKQVYIREFLAANPSMKNEVKSHLQNYLAEKKKPKANPVEALIREAVKEYLNKK